jgi:hypothetical protein
LANPNNPFGFRPVARISGSPFSTTQYGKPSSDSHAIFSGDMVSRVLAAVADPTGAGPNMPGVASAYAGTPGTTLWNGVSLNYGAASSATAHLVCDQTDIILIGQCSGATAISTASHVGLNANISIATAGSALTKQSGMQLDSATLATTATLDLRVLKISALVANAEGANAIVEITINKHQAGLGTVGV